MPAWRWDRWAKGRMRKGSRLTSSPMPKEGAFVGMAVDGSTIAVSDDSNAAYYGKPVRPTDIIVKHSVSNPKSADLRRRGRRS